MIPEHIKAAIEEKLDLKIISTKVQSGGDINQANILTFENGDSYFLKWNSSAPKAMFKIEAKGLKLLSDANTEIIVPKVILAEENFLLLNFIKTSSEKSNSSFQFGTELAKLHRHSSPEFGLNYDNFIGRLHQKNSLHKTWGDFFIQKRIEPQIKLGIDSGKFAASILSNIDKLHSPIDSIFPNEPPALLHGDLWSGNYLFTNNGKSCIYDPAVYYGHREMDIAMTRLFGGFSQEFYNGYNSEYPLADGFEHRTSLYNLYPILVHANLFGGGYVNQAIGILDRYCS